MANETLRARVLTLTGTNFGQTGSDHVIDAKLHTENPSILLMDNDTGDSFYVIWSSEEDSPDAGAGLDARTKISELTYDAVAATRFSQETWDLAFNTPSNTGPNRITGGRFEDTNQILFGGGGGPESYPMAFSRYDYAAATPVVSFYDNYVDGDVSLGYPPSIPSPAVSPYGGEVFDSGSAVELADGRILYVWAEYDEDTDVIFSGNYSGAIKQAIASDITTFLNTNESLTGEVTVYENLGAPECSVWKGPDDEVYMCLAFWGQAGTIYFGATNYHPHTKILKLTDADLGTWTEVSSMSTVNDGGSWDAPGAVTYTAGVPAKNRTVGFPLYVSTSAPATELGTSASNTILLPCILWKEVNIFGAIFQIPKPAIWKTTDNGATWTLKAEFTFGTAGAYGGPQGRHLVEYNSKIWAQVGSQGDLSNPDAKSQVWYSTDDGETWAKRSDNQFDTSPDIYHPYYGIAFFLEPDGTLAFWEAGKIYRYSVEPNVGIPHSEAALVVDWQNTDGADLTTFPGSWTVEIGSYRIFGHKGRVIGVYNNDVLTHNSVTAFVVDMCSQNEYDPFNES